MAEYCILYNGSRMIFATHGHNINMKNPPMLKMGDILLHDRVEQCAVQDDGTYNYDVIFIIKNVNAMRECGLRTISMLGYMHENSLGVKVIC